MTGENDSEIRDVENQESTSEKDGDVSDNLTLSVNERRRRELARYFRNFALYDDNGELFINQHSLEEGIY